MRFVKDIQRDKLGNPPFMIDSLFKETSIEGYPSLPIIKINIVGGTNIEPKDLVMTHKLTCNRCYYYKGMFHVMEHAQEAFDSKVTKFNTDGKYKFMDKDLIEEAESMGFKVIF